RQAADGKRRPEGILLGPQVARHTDVEGAGRTPAGAHRERRLMDDARLRPERAMELAEGERLQGDEPRRGLEGAHGGAAPVHAGPRFYCKRRRPTPPWRGMASVLGSPKSLAHHGSGQNDGAAARLIAWHRDARARTLALVAGLSDEQLMGPRLPIVNPLRWEVGHVGWFQEDWALRHARDEGPLRADGDRLYDSARVAHDPRWDLPLP